MLHLPERLALVYRPATSGEVHDWSYGRVTAARKAGSRRWQDSRGTINDQAIFGPEKDDTCACGKYGGPRYRRMICDRCGVKISTRAERSKRFGHIELAGWVSHPLAPGTAQLLAIPVLPARYVESESGRVLAPVYDSLVLAASADSRDQLARGLERLAEILLPALDFAHRWRMTDAIVLAHGLALEEKKQSL
jgi:hypothetical protein